MFLTSTFFERSSSLAALLTAASPTGVMGALMNLMCKPLSQGPLAALWPARAASAALGGDDCCIAETEMIVSVSVSVSVFRILIFKGFVFVNESQTFS